VFTNTFSIDEFEKEYGCDASELRINDWVGYWTDYKPFYERTYWSYKKDFDHNKWVSYMKELYKQNTYPLYLVHKWFNANNITHLFFDIPVPVVGYKLEYKNYEFSDFNFFAKSMIRFLTEKSDERNAFYESFRNESFFFVDEIDDTNKVTDILIEPVYSGSDTTVWKEFLLPDRPMGTPDNAHPNENGHRKIYQVLKENLKRKLNIN
jgi:hypothetical protein